MKEPVLFARILELKGRDAWALTELVHAGDLGCTPIDTPGPRWSGYVHKLRRRYGLDIETVNEPHGGAFKGTHAVVRLLSGGSTAAHRMQSHSESADAV